MDSFIHQLLFLQYADCKPNQREVYLGRIARVLTPFFGLLAAGGRYNIMWPPNFRVRATIKKILKK
jgi:hypothetical protein